MPVFSGNIPTGSIKITTFNIPSTITSFSLTNKSVGSGTVTFGFVVSGVDVYYKTVTINAGTSYGIDLTDLRMMAGTKILIITTASIDYYITTKSHE